MLVVSAEVSGADNFTLKEGDRVVWIGGTLIEREQRYGNWETALTSCFPDKNVTFRNLGWSGDTVWGEARAGFETATEGYQRLVQATLAQKPTVIMIGYGTNESFAGRAGLARFSKQLNRLLDDLQLSKARIVLLAPLMFEKETWQAPKFAGRVQNLKLYSEAIRQVAQRRHAVYAEEFGQRYGPGHPLTDDGMHLTAYGYYTTTHNLMHSLDLVHEEHVGDNLRFVDIVLDGLTPLRVKQQFLTGPPKPYGGGVEEFQGDSMVQIRNLNPGRYTLRIDDRPVHTADAQEWLKTRYRQMKWPVTLIREGPTLDQAEKLRQTIVEKNRLFFNRWRPQNETYLFGFRKHEQGQNAREIPQFDPLVDHLEKEIFRLRKPVPHTYQLVPAEEAKK
jgi:lysophospholipase L1-like esterase